MQLLLDSHVAIWALTNDRQLKPRARELLLSPNNEVVFSVASVWEIGIKHARGRSGLPFSGEEMLHFMREAGYRILDIRPEHAIAAAALPPLHADPFDRMLVAQAQVEPMHLLTHDALLAGYGALVLLV